MVHSVLGLVAKNTFQNGLVSEAGCQDEGAYGCNTVVLSATAFTFSLLK